MNGADLVTDHMDTWIAARIPKPNAGRGSGNHADGRNFHGIKKLRELILELAVRGKLVPQDPDDKPASVLLKKIAQEKERLIKEGKIKNQKPLPKIREDEKPFELPKGWEWVRLQDISFYIQRGKGPKYAEDGVVNVVSQKCIQWTGFDFSQARFIDDESIGAYQPERFLQQNDLLLNSTGTGTVGRINVLDEVKPNMMVADSHVTVIRPLNDNSKFLWCYVASPGIQLRINPEHEKSLVSGTTKQVELNTISVISLIVPVSPLSEQHRIVAKVDELMALCDQLEQEQADSNQTHQALVETLLANLADASDHEEFLKAWKHITTHFDILFTTEQSIDQLKQTILQLAVMGKLVPQDPTDEPASVLLEKIAKVKERLIKEGKIKKQKPLPKIREEEKPFELPIGWEWDQVGNLSTNIHYGYTAPAVHSNSKVKLLRITDIQNDMVNWDKVPGCEIDKDKIRNYLLEKDDILIARTGGTIGKSYLVENISLKSVFASYLIRVKRIDNVYSPFVKIFLGSKLYWNQLFEKSMGTGQPNVNATALKNLKIPLPPLSEQHRIVDKVDELMTLCDALKDRLNKAGTIQVQLADVVVEKALNSA